jgi:tRNA1Val (adenine37-N6)-methyltransferase
MGIEKGFFEFQKFTIDQSHAAMKVGTDSDLLGALAAGGKYIHDIGTGTGVLSLFMAQRFPAASIMAIDIDENAIIDATTNFANSPFSDRITLKHTSLQNFAENYDSEPFDCIICNPPYYDNSLEAPNKSRARARHTSSLTFKELINGAYQLLSDEGTFSVIIPTEVLPAFSAECLFAGFWLKHCYKIKTLPHKVPKRYILIYKKGRTESTEETVCLRNTDSTYSDWHNEIMKDFLKKP